MRPSTRLAPLLVGYSFPGLYGCNGMPEDQSMPNAGEPSETLPPTPNAGDTALVLPGVVLKPGPRVASRWNGALRSRLNRAPLERFLGRHSQNLSHACRDPVTEGIELATLFIIKPTVPHREHWGALTNPAYFTALGQSISGIARATADVIHEPRLWRVAALRAMGRLLTPVLGIDMAASVTAAAMARPKSQPESADGFGEILDRLAALALSGASEQALLDLRALVAQRLTCLAQCGAANLAAAPSLATISAAPPSNH